MPYLKPVLAGLLSSAIVYLCFLTWLHWKAVSLVKEQGATGLIVVTGAQVYVLRSPAFWALAIIASGVVFFLFRNALVQSSQRFGGRRCRQIDEISATEVVIQGLSISKHAFRGFGNPRALEGNWRDVDRAPGEKLEIMRTRLEELLPELKAINSRDLDYLCQDQAPGAAAKWPRRSRVDFIFRPCDRRCAFIRLYYY